MTVKFTDAAAALDAAVEMEEGTRIERVCVALAKRKWPNLIATETKKDGGEDATYIQSKFSDDIRPGIAVSITNTLTKIKDDAKAIANSGVGIDALYFYTPKKVSNTKARQWAKIVREEFGHELFVISREEIVHSLVEPENEFICEAYLELKVDRSRDLKRIIPCALACARKIAKQWQDSQQIFNKEYIPLSIYRLDSDGNRTADAIDIYGLDNILENSSKILLIGGPGAGKSTTLSKLSLEMATESSSIVPLLISLPELIDSGAAILDYVASQSICRNSSISSADLALLATRGQIVFLLNGWNEIGTTSIQHASRLLNKVAREFPLASIVVTTRNHQIDPLNATGVTYELGQVSESQRANYVRSVTPDHAETLLQIIEGNLALNSLSGSPFILNYLISIYDAGESIPETKAMILLAIIEIAEKSVEHRPALASEPLFGHSEHYLSALAHEMTKKGRTSISLNRAGKVVNVVSNSLVNMGILARSPQPREILSSLCSHHMLTEITYPETAFRFDHQQLQESFTSQTLRFHIQDILSSDSKELLEILKNEIINIPAWEESLILLVEECATRGNKEDIDIVNSLIAWSLEIDPIFSCRIYSKSNQHSRVQFDTLIAPLLRNWYNSKSLPHQACAITAMVSTGSDEFSEIIWSLLESPDRNIRVSALRLSGPISLSTFGKDWKLRVSEWPAEQRIEFIQSICQSQSQDGIDLAHEFSLNDPDLSVRREAISVLMFYASRTKFLKALRESDDELFDTLVKTHNLPRSLPDDLNERKNNVIRSNYDNSKNSIDRITLASNHLSIVVSERLEPLKSDLLQLDLSGNNRKLEQIIFLIMQKVYLIDTAWASEWTTDQILAGNLSMEQWIPYGQHVIPEKLKLMVDVFSDPKSDYSNPGYVGAFLAARVRPEQACELVDKICNLNSQIKKLPSPKPEALASCYRRIERLLKNISTPVLVSSVSAKLSEKIEQDDLSQLLRLLHVGQISELYDDQARNEVPPDILKQFRSKLRELAPLIETMPDYDGSLKASLAIAISRFGAKKDSMQLMKLVESDIQRIKTGLALLSQGQHQHPRAQAARMSWDSWHVSALINLIGEDSDQHLLDLVEQPEYEDAAARGLYYLAHIPSSETNPFTSHVGKYRRAIRQRTNPKPLFTNKEKQHTYASKVKDNLNSVSMEATPDSGYPNMRLKKLAGNLALFCRTDDVNLVLDTLSLEGQWDSYTVIETIEHLVFSGLKLVQFEVSKAIEPIVQKIVDGTEYYSYDKSMQLLKRCIYILLFSDNPVAGTNLLRSLYPSKIKKGDLYDILEIGALTESKEFSDWVLDLLRNDELSPSLAAKAISALGASRTDESDKFILAMLEPSNYPSANSILSREIIEPVAFALVEIIDKKEELLKQLEQKCATSKDPVTRNILGTVVAKLSSSRLDLAALQMIDNELHIPWPVHERLEQILIGRNPSSDFPGAYELVPVEDTNLRPRLFEFANFESTRDRAAYDLLGEIEVWRLEYGKPSFEPRHPNLASGLSWPIITR